MSLKYPTTSETLLDKITSGDEISWNEFYRIYAPIIRTIACFNGLTASDADDICQQVMMQFFQQSKTFRFDPDIARFRTYFGRIVRGRIVDHFRKKKEVPIAELGEESIDPDTEKLYMDEWRKMVIKEAEQKLKKRVSPETFQAYQLYGVQGRPVEKVAAFLECSTNQVYQAKKRCFSILREILLEMNGSDPELQLELSKYEL